MAVSEAERHELYTALETRLGPGPTSTMMSLLPPVGWADVATKADLAALDSSLRGEIAALRGDVAQQLASLETRITDAMRTQLFAMIAAMLTISTLTVAAAAAFV